MRRDLTLVAITVDEGRPGMARIGALAEGMGIEWVASEETGVPPAGCTWPRDRALSSLARRAGATRLALGTTLDDAARSVFLHVLRGDAARLAGSSHGDEEIPCIRPFLRIPEEELALYARLTVPGHLPPREPQAMDQVEKEAGQMLADYTSRHPSAPFAVVNLGEALAGWSGPGKGRQSPCGRCGEPVPPGCPARGAWGREVTGNG